MKRAGRRPLPARAAARGRARRRHPHRRGASAAVRGDDPRAGPAHPHDARRRRGQEGGVAVRRRDPRRGRRRARADRSDGGRAEAASAPALGRRRRRDDGRRRRRRRRRRPVAAVRRVMPLPSARERRLALRLRASELVGLLEATAGADPEADGRPRRPRRGAGGPRPRSAATTADEARAQGLDPLTFRDGRARHAAPARTCSRSRRCPATLQLLVARRVRARARSSTRSSTSTGCRRASEPVAAFAFGTTAHARVRGVHEGAPRASRPRRAAADPRGPGARVPGALDADRRSATRPPRRATSGASRRCSTTSGRARSAASARRSTRSWTSS